MYKYFDYINIHDGVNSIPTHYYNCYHHHHHYYYHHQQKYYILCVLIKMGVKMMYAPSEDFPGFIILLALKISHVLINACIYDILKGEFVLYSYLPEKK